MALAKAVVLVVAFTAGIGTAVAAESSRKDLVFVGTVLLIEKAHAPDTIHNFVVTVSVDEVLSGEFSGTTFEFPVHSVAKALLEYGGVYTIRAKWKRGGYVVYESAIRRQGKSPSKQPPPAR